MRSTREKPQRQILCQRRDRQLADRVSAALLEAGYVVESRAIRGVQFGRVIVPVTR